MILTISNVITVENPTAEFVRWCKWNLVISNPEYVKKSRMGFWTGNTPKTLSLYEVHGNKLILPYGALLQIPSDLVADSIRVGAFAKPVRVDYHAEVPLYDYQEDAVQGLIAAKYGILRSAAGSGKTQIGIALAARLGRRTLWLCHTRDLITQSRERAELYMSKDLMGTITDGKVHLGTGITFATVQTMSRLDLTQYKNYWDVIIVDEVHRVSGTPTAVTQYQKVLGSLAARHKYGLSATVHRSDGMIQATYALMGGVVYEVPDAAVRKRIMRVGILPVATGVELTREALNTDGTLNYTKLITYLTQNLTREEVIVNAIKNEKGHSCLILSDRLEHLEHLMNWLPADMKRDAVMISGKMTTKRGQLERKQALDDMRSGKKKYLFATYSLAKEGLDVPCLERLFLTTPKTDYAVVTQSIGRIDRTYPGKDKPIAYDFVDDDSYLVKSYKKRCAIYRKNSCYFVEGA